MLPSIVPSPIIAPIRASKDELMQIFSNLITNAIDAMPDGGVLTIETREVGDRGVEILVRDKGIGISGKISIVFSSHSSPPRASVEQELAFGLPGNFWKNAGDRSICRAAQISRGMVQPSRCLFPSKHRLRGGARLTVAPFDHPEISMRRLNVRSLAAYQGGGSS